MVAICTPAAGYVVGVGPHAQVISVYGPASHFRQQHTSGSAVVQLLPKLWPQPHVQRGSPLEYSHWEQEQDSTKTHFRN